MASQPKIYRVTVANAKQVIDCAANQTVLQAAIAAGIDYPYICATGNCGTCISHLDAGKVSMLARGDASLSPKLVKKGQRLACRSRPRSDVTMTWLGRGGK